MRTRQFTVHITLQKERKKVFLGITIMVNESKRNCILKIINDDDADRSL